MNLRYIAIIEMKAGDEMKMKEVMDQTGLTRKTVLFYEEQGLLTPQKTRISCAISQRSENPDSRLMKSEECRHRILKFCRFLWNTVSD